MSESVLAQRPALRPRTPGKDPRELKLNSEQAPLFTACVAGEEARAKGGNERRRPQNAE